MNNKLLIIMYHYVRDLANSRYPDIKGLDIALFRKQIEFLKYNFSIITSEQLMEAIYGNLSLPNNSVLLTFDDGYIDHYTNVLPILIENNLQGFFSMPAKILAEGKVLDVNKIHFILSSVNIDKLLKLIFERLDYYRVKGGGYNILETCSNEDLYRKLAIPSRFDTEKVVFIKSLLQFELQEELRNIIVDDLFKKLVSKSEESFAKEIYMSYEQVKLMKKEGMYFGIHGYEHYWLEKLSQLEMEKDISKSLDFFSEIIDRNNWIMCYPYGSYNNIVKKYIACNGCKLGFTTEVKIANIENDDILTLPRLDTNDFPPKSNNYLKIQH